ncbi:MAG: tRNA pseudouridine(55) synthase TruB [Planctomycetota bacterium]
MFGLLNIHKPTGMTSRDVVNRVQRWIRPHKVGHAGTLDPLAEGVLVLGVGPATRLVPYVQRLAKTYVGTFELGQCSDTEDVEGEVKRIEDARQPTADEIADQVPRFVGEIMQQPPAYSALKVQGRRAYELARAGEAPELAARPVMIHQLRVLRYAYPSLQLEIVCGSGTYIRSLGRDLAIALGTQAVMSALCRTQVGPFTLERAVRLDDLNPQNLETSLLPASLAVAELPKIEVNAAERQALSEGRTLPSPVEVFADTSEWAAIDAAGGLVAVLRPAASGGLRPYRNFANLPD